MQVKVWLPDASNGCWPSIWFLPGLTNDSQNELDAYEGGFNQIGAGPKRTVHFDYFGPAGQQASEQDVSAKIPSITDMSAGYHIIGVQWTPGSPGSINWYIDGTLMNSYSGSVTPQGYEIMLDFRDSHARGVELPHGPHSGQLPHLHHEGRRSAGVLLAGRPPGVPDRSIHTARTIWLAGTAIP